MTFLGFCLLGFCFQTVGTLGVLSKHFMNEHIRQGGKKRGDLKLTAATFLPPTRTA